MTRIVAIFFCSLGVSVSAQAVPITWVDWTSADTISASGNAGSVDVSFSGAQNPASQTNCGTAYWSVSPSTYTSPEVDNGPADCDIIRITGGAASYSISFSETVVDPVMAILSMGQLGVPVFYDFDTDFDILNVGPGFFGNGTMAELSGDILQGNEGHGIIQFKGNIDQISWTSTSEFWHGFTFGIAGVAEPCIPGETCPIAAPAPGTIALFGLGLAGLGFATRRKKNT